MSKQDHEDLKSTHPMKPIRKKAKKEAVNHPKHYGGDVPYEAKKVIRAWDLNFSLGNTVKYISRVGKKDPKAAIEDLEKARWYLDDQIRFLKDGTP